MSEDDVLFGYRLQLVDLAGRIGVAAACHTFGVHRSTSYAWKHKIEREGLGALRPRERRRPRMPNQLSPLVEQCIVAFALGHPGRVRGGSRPSSRTRAGAGLSSPQTASGAACAGTASTRAPSGSASSPAMQRRTNRRGSRQSSGTSRLSGRRARWLRLLLRRPPAQHEGDGLAADRDRRLLLVRLGAAGQLQTRPAERGTDLKARPGGGERATGRRLAARAGAQRQRQRVSRLVRANARAARRTHDQDPRRPPPDQRRGRSAPQDDPR